MGLYGMYLLEVNDMDSDANQIRISIEHILEYGCANISCEDCPIDVNIDNEANLCDAIGNIHSTYDW